VNPVWFRWDGKYVWSTMTTARQRYKNMTAHPEVALSIVDSGDPYRYPEIRARVVRMLADPLAAEFRRLADRYHVAVDSPVADSSRRIAVALLPAGVSYQLGLPRFGPHTSDSTQQ
ncbi:MAG TPA: hypothetical protein VF482_07335, partial [Trebonia sp.]